MRDTATAAAAVGVCVQKGGVGKTTVVLNLGVGCARLGLRVLVWDLDPAHYLTSHLGVPGTLVGSYEVLIGKRGPLDVIRRAADEPGFEPGLDLLPSSRKLTELRDTLERADAYARPWLALREPLAEVRALGDYDLILFDAPPTLEVQTRCIYLAADAVLSVVTPNEGSLEGLEKTLGELVNVRRAELNPRLRLLGVVLNETDRRTNATERAPGDLRALLGRFGEPAGALLATEIPRRQAIVEAWRVRQSIWQKAPRDDAARAFGALALEVAARLGLEVAEPAERTHPEGRSVDPRSDPAGGTPR